MLNSILFGEGIFNDAISIVLFRSVQKILSQVDSFKEIDSSIAIKLFLDFSYLLIMSVLIGMGVGIISSLLFKKFDKIDPIKEASIILLSGYLSYLVSEIFHLSGIISLFCCGVLLAIYAYPNLS